MKSHLMYRWNMCYKTDFTKTGGEKTGKELCLENLKAELKQ